MGCLVLVGVSFFLVGLLVLRSFWGPPPALAGSGNVKLNLKVPPTVRVCGATDEAAVHDAAALGLTPRGRGNRRRRKSPPP